MSYWNLFGGLANAGASVYSTYQNNKNIDKQLAAQKQENQATREYNLQLAKQQNQWNIEQWNRENAYNTPSAQKERLQQAGINADMLYGQGTLQNVAASSPQMSSGAAATPMDWSALGGKKSVGDTIMQALAVEQARANINKTNAEAKDLGMSNDIRQQLIDKGMIIEEKEYELLSEQVNHTFNLARKIDLENTIDQLHSDIVVAYRDKIVENYLQRLESSTKMSANALKQDIETLTLRIAGINAENSKLDRLSDFGTDEKRLLFDVVAKIFELIVK